MAAEPQAEAALALHRFGFGPRSGSITAISSDPRGALLAELDRLNVAQITEPALRSSREAARAIFDFRQAQRSARTAQRPSSDGQMPTEQPQAQPP